jgi:hypothetical protein
MRSGAVSLGAPSILLPPRSRVAEVDTFVDFSVIATNVDRYQWKMSDASAPGTYTNIPSATSSNYYITNVTFMDVASYVVDVISTNFGTTTSQPAHLAAYLVYPTNSSAGVLETPIGWFSTSETVTCEGSSFPQGYCPHDDYGIYYLFYGPTAPGSTGPFANTEYKRYLTVDTFHADNGTADTAVRLRKNWTIISPIICCEDSPPPGTFPSPAAQCGPIDMIGLGWTDKDFKLVVYYKGTPPASGKVAFNWKYN